MINTSHHQPVGYGNMEEFMKMRKIIQNFNNTWKMTLGFLSINILQDIMHSIYNITEIRAKLPSIQANLRHLSTRSNEVG